MAATGSVEGLSLRIHHAFSTDDALALSLDSVNFSVTMLPSTLSSSHPVLSIVIRLPYVEGRLNMRHFTHFIIFQRTWLDRAARTTSRIPQVIPAEGEKAEPSSPMVLPIHLVAQLGKGALKMDFGQQLGKMDLLLNSIHGSIAQEMIEGDLKERMKTEILGKVNDLSGEFNGRLSGHLNLGPLSGHVVLWDGGEMEGEEAKEGSPSRKSKLSEKEEKEEKEEESYGRLRGTIMLDGLSTALIYEYQSLLMLRVGKTYIATLRGGMPAAEMVTPETSTWSSGLANRQKGEGRGVEKASGSAEGMRRGLPGEDEVDLSVLGLFIRVQNTDLDAILSTRTLPILLMLVNRTRKLVESKIQAAHPSSLPTRDSTLPSGSTKPSSSASPVLKEGKKTSWNESTWISGKLDDARLLFCFSYLPKLSFNFLFIGNILFLLRLIST